jgi:ribosomal protein L20
MTKLEIIESKQGVRESKTPNTISLSLPFTLAQTQKAGINAVAKSIKDIQKDLYALEDDNQYNEAIKDVNILINKEYDKYLNSTDVEAPNKFDKTLSKDAFSNILNKQNLPVQRRLLNKIAEQKALLVPKLSSQVSKNVVDAFGSNLDKSFDNAISGLVSTDLATIAFSTNAFNSLANNEVYRNYLGPKTYDELVKKKTNLKNKILLNTEIKINPKSVLANQDALLEAVGPEAAKEYVNEARKEIISKRAQKNNKERIELLVDQDSKIGTFTEVLLRINNFRTDPTDENFTNELPTISEVFELYDLDLINEAMFVKLSDILSEPGRIDAQSTALSNDEIFRLVTEQFAAAKTIQQLDDVKKSYILDQEVLMNLALNDISTLNTLVDKAKSNFESHKDYKQYLGQIKDSIRNIDRVRSRDAQAVALAIATKENEIVKSYNRKVADGMKPELAYLDVLSEEMPKEFIPTLDTLVLPTRVADIKGAIGNNPEKFFEDLNKEVLENYRINQTATGAKRMIEDLDKINFFRDIFYIRNQIGGMEFALKEGGKIKNIEIDRGDIK